MEMTPKIRVRPDIGQWPHGSAWEDDEAQDGETAADDLCGMLGYRAPRTSIITTQLWLDFRLIEL